MNRYTKLIKNSAIFAIANLGSHLISFLLVRFYTEFLTTEQYGIIDFFVTTSSLIIPIISISIVEAVLRFSIDEKRKNDVLCNGFLVTIIGSVIFLIVGPFVFYHTSYYQYFWFFYFLVLFTSIDGIFAQFIRGSGKVTVFAISGIIKTFTLVGCNLIFILIFHMRVEGYLLSLIVSEIATIAFLIVASKLYKGFVYNINCLLMKQMIVYSIPLIPNSLSWWIMNAADKYVIIAVLGNAANGLYAVAHKLPTLINLCNSLFFQAWQLSAVEESDSETKSEFYSNVFNLLAFLLFSISGLLLLFLKPIMNILVAESFSGAWKYSPFLILSMVFAAFSSFLGTNYIAMKQTKGALKTTIVGAIVNIFLNIVLIKKIGMNGPALATMISFGITWLYRTYDTKNFVVIHYKLLPLVTSTCLLIIQSVLLIREHKLCEITGLMVLILICCLYFKEMKVIISRIVDYTKNIIYKK